MKRNYIFLIIGLALLISCKNNIKCQVLFKELTTIKISEEKDIVESISFDNTLTEIINKKYSELETNDPFRMEFCEGEFIKLIRTKIDRNSNKYYIISYNPSCCCPYGFYIYEDGNPNKIIGELEVARIFIPGDGFVYSDGRMWNNYNKRQKFSIANDTINEIKQPYSYVGLKSKALRDIKIFNDKNLKMLIATIPKDADVEVLINDKSQENLYLLRTDFGIVGWSTVESRQYEAVDIDNLYYWGDH